MYKIKLKQARPQQWITTAAMLQLHELLWAAVMVQSHGAGSFAHAELVEDPGPRQYWLRCPEYSVPAADASFDYCS